MVLGVAISTPETMVSGVLMDPINHVFSGVNLHLVKNHGLWVSFRTP
jgi:hypothetical protein